jgi:hypothetical protein
VSFTEPPSERPKLDLSQVTREWAEASWRRIPPAEIDAVMAKLQKATAQADKQRAWIDTAAEVLKVIFKVAIA